MADPFVLAGTHRGHERRLFAVGRPIVDRGNALRRWCRASWRSRADPVRAISAISATATPVAVPDGPPMPRVSAVSAARLGRWKTLEAETLVAGGGASKES